MNMSLLEIYNPSDDSYKGYVPGIRFMENQPIPHFQQFGTLTMTQRNGLLFTHSLTNNIYGIDNKGVHIKYRIDFGDSEVNPKSWTVDYDANLVNLY